MTQAFYSHLGGRNLLDFERRMKRLVFDHGAVTTTIEVGSNSSNYGQKKHGVFAVCPRRHLYKTDHAVAMVGKAAKQTMVSTSGSSGIPTQ